MINYVDRIYECPDIRSQADAEIIIESLENSPAIESVEVDLALRKVYVRMTEIENEGDILNRLSHAGFPAEEPVT